jgi:hypothetical protein
VLEPKGVAHYADTLARIPTFAPSFSETTFGHFAQCVLLDPPYGVLMEPWDRLKPETMAQFLQMGAACLTQGSILWAFQQPLVSHGGKCLFFVVSALGVTFSRSDMEKWNRHAGLTKALHCAGHATADLEHVF